MQAQSTVFKSHPIQRKKQKQEFKSGSMRQPLVIIPSENIIHSLALATEMTR
jgi:hypothetical protein